MENSLFFPVESEQAKLGEWLGENFEPWARYQSSENIFM